VCIPDGNAFYAHGGLNSYDASLLKLAVSILMDIYEEWVTSKSYLSMEEE